MEPTELSQHQASGSLNHESVDEFDKAMGQLDPLYEIDIAGAERFVTSLHLLREARRASGLSQAAVAELMGTQQSAVSELERGVCDPQISTLRRYAAAIGKFMNIEFSDRLPIARFAALVEVRVSETATVVQAAVGSTDTIAIWGGRITHGSDLLAVSIPAAKPVRVFA